jgi:hypothetical protein
MPGILQVAYRIVKRTRGREFSQPAGPRVLPACAETIALRKSWQRIQFAKDTMAP